MKRIHLLLGLVAVLVMAGCGSMAAEIGDGPTPSSGITAGRIETATPAEIPGITTPVMVKNGRLIIVSASLVEEYSSVIDFVPSSAEEILLVVKAKVFIPNYQRGRVFSWGVTVNDGIAPKRTDTGEGELGLNRVTWLFEVDRTEISFTIHLPGGVDVPLDSLIFAPASTMAPTLTKIPPTPTRSPDPVLQDETALAVAAGREHTCAVTAAGGVKCWGSNDRGQLGDGTFADSPVPVDVEGISGAVEITAGWKHTCARTAGGAVMCWGYNVNGELGDGTTEDSPVPTAVSGLGSGVAMIDAGDDHTCAVTGSGDVKCWGYNEFGQLGDGTTASRAVPVAVQGIAGKATAVAAGWGHSCALTDDGSVECWGNNELGQLGNGQEEENRFAPVGVEGLARTAAKLGADGGQSCALTLDGDVRCWGNNTYGQLGDGTAEVRRNPVAVEGLTPHQKGLAVGWNHTCAVDGEGELRCWGWNFYGQLGDGTKGSRTKPGGVVDLPEGVRALGLGWAHTCAVTESGAVCCWGSNEFGQLGDGGGADSPAPVAVPGWIVAPTATMGRTPTPSRTSTPQGGIGGITYPVTVDGVELIFIEASIERRTTYDTDLLTAKAKILTKGVTPGLVSTWMININGLYPSTMATGTAFPSGLIDYSWTFSVDKNETTFEIHLQGGVRVLLDSLLR